MIKEIKTYKFIYKNFCYKFDNFDYNDDKKKISFFRGSKVIASVTGDAADRFRDEWMRHRAIENQVS